MLTRKRWWISVGGLATAILILLMGASYVLSRQAAGAASPPAPPSRPSRDLSLAAPRHDAWRILGPGGGGAQYQHSISPLDPNLILVSCDMSGNYISHDGGNTWRMFNLGGQATAFIFDPSDAKVIYALANGMFRSDDAGDTWKMVYPAPASIKEILFSDDEGAAIFLTSRGVLSRITALAIDPDNQKVLYATPGTMLSVSTDHGSTWKTLGTIAHGAARKVYIDPFSPKNDRTVYVMTWDRVYIYEHGTWRGNDPIPGTKQVLEAAASFSPSGPVFYVLIDHRFEGSEPKVLGGLLASHDRGATWKQVHRGMLESVADRWFVPELRAVVAVDGRPDELFISYSKLRLKSNPKVSYFGVAHTLDGGASWEYLWQSASTQPPNIHDAWLTERFGTYWAENPLAMAVHKNLLIAGDLGRTMRSTDRGKNWEAVYSRHIEEGYATTGLDVTTSYGVHFDPFDPNRLFISYTDIGLFRSETGGDTWVSSTEGVDRSWLNTTYWMEFDPEVRGRAWAVTSNTHDLPRTRMLRRGTANFKGGVITSADGGRSWQKSNNGMSEAACTHIVLDPTSPRENRRLYVAAMGHGVYRSVDGGKNWQLKSAGLPGPAPLVWRLALNGDALYAVIARRKDSGKPGSSDDGAIYRSMDHGDTWSRLELPAGLNGPTGISFGQDVSQIYVSAWARTDPVFAKNLDGGVFVSRDSGKTWAHTLKDPNIYDVTVDPGNANRVYAAGFESSAWRSDDHGKTWSRIRGFNFKGGHRVIPDPRNRDRIFITTFGGSVWYGPAGGDPKAIEDIITRPLAFTEK